MHKITHLLEEWKEVAADGGKDFNFRERIEQYKQGWRKLK